MVGVLTGIISICCICAICAGISFISRDIGKYLDKYESNGKLKDKGVIGNDNDRCVDNMKMRSSLYTQDVILVTGGVGFVGGHLSERLLQEGYRVIVYDIFNSETTPSIEKQETAEILKKTAIENNDKGASLKIINGDITDENKLRSVIINEGISACFHIAAMVDDRRSVKYPFEYIDINIKGCVILLKILAENDIKTVIQASTRSVFGQVINNNQLIDEKTERLPINPYGATKVATDAFAHVYSHLYQMNIVLIRIFATYGPRGRKDMIPRICIDNIHNEIAINKFGDGSATRTWIYITDVIDAFYLAFKAIKEMKINGFNQYNIGTNKSTTLNEMIDTATKVVGKKPIINNLSVPKGDAHTVGHPNWNKIKQELNWSPKYTLKEGLTETHQYLLKKDQNL